MGSREKESTGREKVVEKPQQERSKQQQQEVTTTTSPPSATSSPSHEFSFTISVHSSNTPVCDDHKSRTTPHHGPFAVDLTPADDIFFHGHLLPLHLLSHLPAVSPRSSINSSESFTLPFGELLDDHRYSTTNSCSISNDNRKNNSSSSSSGNNTINCSDFDNEDKGNDNQRNNSCTAESKGRSNKPKYSFSLFGWRKGNEEVRDNKEEDKDKQKRKLRFEVSHLLKRYMRMVRPLLFSKGRRENLEYGQRKAHSFSGNLGWRSKRELRGRRREYSAPASMRTSPTNSGLLVATATLPSSTSDSTMEELQAAIQAAIAHCKNSINASEEKVKC